MSTSTKHSGNNKPPDKEKNTSSTERFVWQELSNTKARPLKTKKCSRVKKWVFSLFMIVVLSVSVISMFFWRQESTVKQNKKPVPNLFLKKQHQLNNERLTHHKLTDSTKESENNRLPKNITTHTDEDLNEKNDQTNPPIPVLRTEI